MTVFADLSHHQATVDLAAYARAGYDRVFLKATQGTTGTDPMFAARWQRAGALGLARGAYHFAEAEDSGAADFDHFIAVVKAAGGLRPADLLCLDSEDPPNISRADEHAREFTNRAVARGYPNGCLYTGRWYADPANLRPDDLAPGWRRLWISDYGSTADSAIALPAGWSRSQVIARQYTDSATIPGVAGRCDASRLLKEWITMTLTDADARLVARALVPYMAEITTGFGNSVDNNPQLQELRRTLNTVVADVAAIKESGAARIDLNELAAALAGPVAIQLAQHLQLKAV